MAVNIVIRNELPEDSVIFDVPSYDNAIIGITDDDRVVYSFEKMVEELMNDAGFEEIDAIEFLEVNVLRGNSLVYNAPIIVYKLMI